MEGKFSKQERGRHMKRLMAPQMLLEAWSYWLHINTGAASCVPGSQRQGRQEYGS